VRLEDLLHIDVPIIQAPMAGVQGSALAIAVSNAGGLGSLPCATLERDALIAELESIREGTDRPYNVNFFCHAPPACDRERDEKWRELLLPYYAAYGLDPDEGTRLPLRRPFSAAEAEVLEAFHPPVVSFHFGLPSVDLLARVKGWGAKVFASATTVTEARWLEAHGADAIIAQGIEAGGHRGMFLTDDLTTQMGTLALVPQVVAAVDVPVIAAGGIADASGVNAAKSLGAAGVQVGTAYLLCPEATTSHLHRSRIKEGIDLHTAVTNLFSGRPSRGIVNRLMNELGPINAAAPAFPLASIRLAPLRQRGERVGRGDFSPLWCGQNATGCRELSAALLTQALAGRAAG
jgi:nitronate monooxygenase